MESAVGRLAKTAMPYNPVKWGDWLTRKMSEVNLEMISAAHAVRSGRHEFSIQLAKDK
jgi:hypothetical protein